MIITALLLSAIGAILSLDKSTIGQFGISQPIVALPILGIIFGELNIGLFLGSLLQLIWITDLPLGSKEPQDSETAGIASMVSYLFINRLFPSLSKAQILFICLLWAGVIAIASRKVQKLLKHYSNRLLKYYRIVSIKRTKPESLPHDEVRKILQKPILIGIGSSFVSSFILIIIVLGITVISSPLFKLLPEFTYRETLAVPLIISAANLLKFIMLEKKFLISLLGALTGFIIWSFLIL
jgi:mannose/fructose/N-acetylgalactosamine-specific phosphotransferase system component IIC